MGGLPSVLSLLEKLWVESNPSALFKPPRLHKFPLPSGLMADHDSLIYSLPQNSYTPSPKGTIFHDLHDSQIFTASDPLKTTFQVLYIPGHTYDSIALYIPFEQALYTGDTVLGQGSTVFEDLSAYMASLRKMLDFGRSSPYTQLYPGHGPVVTSGSELIETYIKHRVEREEQIMQVLQTKPTSSDSEELIWTTWTIVGKIYAQYPENLWLPAVRSVDLHLKKLESEGKVRKAGGEGKDTGWVLTAFISGTVGVQ